MQEIHIPHPNGNLYIITDSHLEYSETSYGSFIKMLTKLQSPHTIICLGDLFKAWLSLPKFWETFHFEVMEAFETLRKRKCNVIFIGGNRELLLPKNYDEYWKKSFPFTHLAHHDFYISWGNQRYGFIHGDTINQNDHNYLRWRKISHSPAFESVFRMMPSSMARWVANKVEASLSKTNQEFKISFPEEEVTQFAQKVLNDVDRYFVGHFHVEKTITLDEVRGTLHVVPDWLAQQSIICITPDGRMETIRF